MQINNKEFILLDKKNEANNVTSLYFKTSDGSPFLYKSGQYINVKPLSVSGHGKSYTISSSPSEKLLCLTVKRKGTVSSALIDLAVGEKITFDGPYGFFYPEVYDKDIVMIAGGIGITPFYSILKDKISNNIPGKIYLFYSNKILTDITFFEDLNKVAKENTWLNVVHCITQEKTKHPSIKEHSRIDKKMFKKYLTSFSNKNYFICGSISFVNDMWKLLKENGVLEEEIFTESFF